MHFLMLRKVEVGLFELEGSLTRHHDGYKGLVRSLPPLVARASVFLGMKGMGISQVESLQCWLLLYRGHVCFWSGVWMLSMKGRMGLIGSDTVGSQLCWFSDAGLGALNLVSPFLTGCLLSSPSRWH